jgi:ribosome-binding protein aMBF1 (putative translation factor)
MAKRRTSKRQPGGGRRSVGPYRGVRETITLRITADVDEGIREHAKARGWSMAQSAEHLFREALGLDVYELVHREVKNGITNHIECEDAE